MPNANSISNVKLQMPNYSYLINSKNSLNLANFELDNEIEDDN